MAQQLIVYKRNKERVLKWNIKIGNFCKIIQKRIFLTFNLRVHLNLVINLFCLDVNTSFLYRSSNITLAVSKGDKRVLRYTFRCFNSKPIFWPPPSLHIPHQFIFCLKKINIFLARCHYWAISPWGTILFQPSLNLT